MPIEPPQIEVDPTGVSTLDGWTHLVERLQQCMLQTRGAQWIVRQHRQRWAEILRLTGHHPRSDAEGTGLR